MFDIIIKNGKLVDFDSMELVNLDIGIVGNKIIKISSGLQGGKRVIDANGKIVSPGFIDIHMHEETIANIEANDSYDILNSMLNMGVTTCVGGNCGINGQSVKDYFEYIDRNKAPVNFLSFLGHNHYRNLLGINKYEPAKKEEIIRMKELIRNDIIGSGAIGISFGIEYSPGIQYNEMFEIAEYVNDMDILLTAHYRADSTKGIEAVKELIRISEETGIPMQISHLGSCTAMGQMKDALKEIDNAIKRGIDVKADCYPYTAFSTHIGSSVFDDGCFENWGKSYEHILLTEEPYRNVRCTKEIFQEVREKYPQMLVVAFVMNEEEVILALNNKNVCVASDGILFKGQGHPRAAGTFPRIIGKYVRDEKKLRLIDQLYKMSKFPALRLKLFNKGEIKEGMDADIVIFDYAEITDQATFSNPIEPPMGISWIINNGKIAMEHGEIINNKTGKVIRKNYH